MNASQATPGGAGGLSLKPSDIYYIIFRHKWKIVIMTMLGLIGGAATYKLWPSSYNSQAQLLIKYVTENREVVDESGGIKVIGVGGRNNQAMQTELAILRSMDLAIEVDADAEDLKNTLADDKGKKPQISAGKVKSGLTAASRRSSNIITLTYNHENRELAKPILQQVIDTYLARHVRIHQDRGSFDDLLIQQTDQAKARLIQTDEELIAARRQAGLISIEQARGNLIKELARIRQTINDTNVEIAEAQELYQQLTGQFDTAAGTDADEKDGQEEISISEVEVANAVRAYEQKRTQLEVLRSRANNLLNRFQPQSSRYQNALAQLETVEKEVRELAEQYPSIFAANSIENQIAGVTPDEIAQKARLQQVKVNALITRKERLEEQMQEIQTEATRIDKAELTINELKRRKAQDESNYRILTVNLEKNRLSDAQNTGGVSNIKVLQSPTNPSVAQSVKAKVAGGVLGGLIVIGLAWAFLLEMLFDQTIKRPSEIAKYLGIPLFLTLPDTESKSFQKLTKRSSTEHKRAIGVKKAEAAKSLNEYKPVSGTLQAAAKAQPEVYGSPSSEEKSEISPWEETHPLHNYFEALRDKVVGYFESKNLTHNPKLIAMTGLGKEPGVTTIASGLASSLSKTEGGNVLLVDMTLGQENAQQFYKGKAVGNIDEALESRDKGQLDGNLYVVAEGTNGYKLPSILPRRFNSIIPKLKASDFDYIIFDMPAVSPISSTPRLASFMDITLMVVESESTGREVAKQATELLQDSNVKVGAILNKTKSYVPSQLEQDFIGLS